LTLSDDKKQVLASKDGEYIFYTKATATDGGSNAFFGPY